ncbi:hypothetical protein QBC41DRAFT_302153 [Cercophora samala]|uniref:Uncharacterized protein n=1 Tax=Cercophora samala TaxID=330535 RepID=A0AA40DCA4_9PEZI|nr:hypothetical protein QBC41DRAFT_302153 [Cercophora samala]
MPTFTEPPKRWHGGEECPNEIIASQVPRGIKMQTIYAALLKCPNITTLKIRGVWHTGGCVITENPYWMSFPFDHLGQDRFPSRLEVLTLDGYMSDELGGPQTATQWYYSRLPWWADGNKVDRTMLCGVQSTKTSMERWVEAMDFSKLHTLNFIHEGGEAYSLTETVAKVLPSRLPNLRKLSLYYRVGQKFILGLPQNSLHHLAWRNAWQRSQWDHPALPSPLIPVLRRQGASLKSFYFHTDETQKASAPVLTICEIRRLVELAPNIQSLVIDLRRSNSSGMCDWPWDELKVMAEGLPELVDLTVYFDLVVDVGRAGIAKPKVDQDAAVEISQFLWKYKAGKPLHRLTLRAGDWGTQEQYGMMGPPWFAEKRAQARCTVVDEAAHVDSLGPIWCEAWQTKLDGYSSIFSPGAKLEWEDRFLDPFFR